MENVHAIEFKNITKRFGSVVANNHVDLYVDHGVVMAILGENGSGKTSLMNMVAGIYYPDEGEIFVEGKKVTIKTPKDAFAVGVGMIHQHFKLIDVFTAAQNVILGLEEEKMDLKAVSKKVKEIADKYGFEIDPDKKVYEMSVSEKQTVEIIKVLYRGADILILDEPTAVLTPQETEKLFNVLRSMREAGKTVIIITHKLNEVMEISDVVAVMRKGEHIKTVRTVNTNPDELTEMMVGHSITLDIKRVEPKNPKPRITVADL
ncbi:MAG: ATP-binding cassette domain-containing protein, partial [Erysipelotrichaceae bacterium]|nr:ATP-binding cassette domain-containing protein [Erysipelotrichaceae bacterium]